jgi:hypothetical protein
VVGGDARFIPLGNEWRDLGGDKCADARTIGALRWSKVNHVLTVHSAIQVEMHARSKPLAPIDTPFFLKEFKFISITRYSYLGKTRRSSKDE